MATKTQNAVKTQTYVEYQYPGIITQETSWAKIEQRDAKKISDTIPEGAIGFRFFDRTEVQEGKETLVGKPKNHSGWYYVGGREMTLADVKKEMPDKTILIRNMESNGYSRIVFTRHNQALPLEKNDVVLESSIETLARK